MRAVPRTLVDANILIDIAQDDPHWADWSARALMDCQSAGPLVINAVVFSEVSIGFERIEPLEDFLSQGGFLYEEISPAAAFLAGKCFLQYRKAGGIRSAPLPDFFIGAHAAVAGMRLLTRDAGRYRTYFPSLNILAPSARN